jgi:hypothetical protein
VSTALDQPGPGPVGPSDSTGFHSGLKGWRVEQNILLYHLYLKLKVPQKISKIGDPSYLQVQDLCSILRSRENILDVTLLQSLDVSTACFFGGRRVSTSDTRITSQNFSRDTTYQLYSTLMLGKKNACFFAYTSSFVELYICNFHWGPTECRPKPWGFPRSSSHVRPCQGDGFCWVEICKMWNREVIDVSSTWAWTWLNHIESIGVKQLRWRLRLRLRLRKKCQDFTRNGGCVLRCFYRCNALTEPTPAPTAPTAPGRHCHFPGSSSAPEATDMATRLPVTILYHLLLWRAKKDNMYNTSVAMQENPKLRRLL